MKRLTVPADLPPEAIAKLIVHGCGVHRLSESMIVALPEGTTRNEILPRAQSERYTILFPDGFQMREHYDGLRGCSILFL